MQAVERARKLAATVGVVAAMALTLGVVGVATAPEADAAKGHSKVMTWKKVGPHKVQVRNRAGHRIKVKIVSNVGGGYKVVQWRMVPKKSTVRQETWGKPIKVQRVLIKAKRR